MTKLWLPLCGIAALAACAPQVPDSAAGVGFGNYDTYARQSLAREAMLQTPLNLAPQVTGAPGPTGGSGTPAIGQSELAAAGIDIGADVRVKRGTQRIYGPTVAERPTVGQPVQVAPLPPGTRYSSSARAVPATEGAPADPTGQFAAGPPAGGTGANVVAYALGSTNPVGQPLYPRPLGWAKREARACGRYAAPDLAQRAFLEAGGPQRDRMGLDPDGDGFACGWTPDALRRAVRG